MAIQTALVVDDSRSARYILQRLLEQRRIQVAVAASAAQAFDYLRGHRPDVVFMDDLMPGMDGLQAVERLGADPRTADIPVILYTGSAYADAGPDQAAAAPARRGIIGVLSKPFTQGDVSALLAKLDGLPAARPQPPQLRRVPPAVAAQPAGSAPRRESGAPHVQSLDTLRTQLAESLKAEARRLVEQILGDKLESRIAAQIERHAAVWRQGLEHVRLEQLRSHSHLVDERLPRWQARLEQRLDAALAQQTAALQTQIDAARNAEQLSPSQRLQISNIVRAEAAGLIERPARQSARHVAAELMRGDLSALNLRVERVRRRLDRAIIAAPVAALAAGAVGFLAGRFV